MKRGNLIRSSLIWDFDSSNACYVQLPSGTWVQVTPNDFRSFDGPRKLVGSVLGKDRVSRPFERFYDGPVYGHGTNFEMPKTGCRQVIYHVDNPRIQNKPRIGENF